MKSVKEKFLKNVFKWGSILGALVFIIAQGEGCIIWLYQPKLPHREKKFSIKEL